MRNYKITTDEIRETFYNLILESALDLSLNANDLDNDTIRILISNSLQIMCQRVTEDGYPTIKGRYITSTNIHEYFLDVYNGLEQFRAAKTEDEKTVILTTLVDGIEKNHIFQQVIVKFKNFYKESQLEVQEKEVTSKIIYETFYNMMVDQVLADDLISKDSLENREPYIFIAMSSKVILTSIIDSKKFDGIILHNRAIVKKHNCPHEYAELFAELTTIKDNFVQFNLTPNQIELIKICSTTNPVIIIPDHLEALRTPALMQIVANIVKLSTTISQLNSFKTIINKVISFCVDIK
jgi:hypothetical protein